MRVLLDECLPRPLKREITGHDVTTVPEVGWAGTKNGALLRLTASRFSAFVTIDQGLRYQQNLAALTRGTSLGVVVLAAPIAPKHRARLRSVGSRNLGLQGYLMREDVMGEALAVIAPREGHPPGLHGRFGRPSAGPAAVPSAPDVRA